MSARKLMSLTPVVAVALLVAAAAPLSLRAADYGLKPGKVELRSIGALEMGPDGILFVADSQAAAVYALEVGQAAAKGTAVEEVGDLDGKIAALLGTSPRNLFIRDMAVEPTSGSAYLSVQRGQGDEARPVLIRVTRDGEIGAVSLESIRHARIEISNPPPMDGRLYRWSKRTLTVTDLELVDGELFIAGLSNEEFASTLRRVPFPFTEGTKATSLEIYHGAHGKFETHAPIFSFIPYQIDGATHLLAGYLCTPLVTFPLDQVRSHQKLRGKTIAELGFGNIPVDMIPFEKDGEEYLLVINSTRGTMRIKAADIRSASKRPGIVEEVDQRVGVDYLTSPVGHVAQADDLDKDNILILTRSMENGSLTLGKAAKRWL